MSGAAAILPPPPPPLPSPRHRPAGVPPPPPSGSATGAAAGRLAGRSARPPAALHARCGCCCRRRCWASSPRRGARWRRRAGTRLTDGDLLATLCDGQLPGAGSHVEGAAAASHGEDPPPPSGPMYRDRALPPRAPVAARTSPRTDRDHRDRAGAGVATRSCSGGSTATRPPRVTKTIPPGPAPRLPRRDRGRCVVPGCRNARYVDVHHIVPRAQGGKHTPTKLAVMCSAHHKAAHARRLRIDGTAPPPSCGSRTPTGGRTGRRRPTWEMATRRRLRLEVRSGGHPPQARAEVEAPPAAARSRRVRRRGARSGTPSARTRPGAPDRRRRPR